MFSRATATAKGTRQLPFVCLNDTFNSILVRLTLFDGIRSLKRDGKLNDTR